MRATTKQRRPDKGSRWSWDSQRLKPDLNSSAGRRRFGLGFLKRCSLLFVLVLALSLGLVGLQLLQSWYTVPGLGQARLLPELHITGNSSLPDTTIEKMVRPVIASTFAGIRPYRIKAALEQNGQVKQADVVKDYPNRLKIHITERLPILMLAAADAGDQLSFWAIDEMGFVFRPFDLQRMKALELPFVEGLELDRIEDGVTQVDGIGRVHYLLQLLEREAFDVYQDIRSVSLREYNTGEAELGAVIILRCSRLPKIVFGVENFEYQVVKLLGVLSVAGRVSLSEKNVIDLSYSADAIVR